MTAGNFFLNASTAWSAPGAKRMPARGGVTSTPGTEKTRTVGRKMQQRYRMPALMVMLGCAMLRKVEVDINHFKRIGDLSSNAETHFDPTWLNIAKFFLSLRKHKQKWDALIQRFNLRFEPQFKYRKAWCVFSFHAS